MEGKVCESTFHDHDHDFCIIMVGWVNTLDSDWCDLRRRHAVDISSFQQYKHDGVA